MVSTHAPLWGATEAQSMSDEEWFCFNPRAPMGRDAHDRFVIKCAFGFNPRAPMGRDDFCMIYCVRVSGFNPRAPMGRDW